MYNYWVKLPRVLQPAAVRAPYYADWGDRDHALIEERPCHDKSHWRGPVATARTAIGIASDGSTET